MAERVAFLGLGVMGAPMAGHLAAAGLEVVVYNRTAEKARAWAAAHGGRAAPTPGEAADGATFVAACVLDDATLRAVTVGTGGAFEAMGPDAVFVDHSTVTAALARTLGKDARERGFAFLDAPVAGAVEGATKGALSAMVGGEADALEKARPFLSCYTRAVRLMGPVGHGQLAKMVSQIVQATTIEGLCEGLRFAHASGLNPERLMAALSSATARSWWQETRGRQMFANLDAGHHVKHGRQGLLLKDLAICLTEARRLGIGLPVTGVVSQLPGTG
ncbi:MAG: NAD(P)-dependent oxidoreductase [Rhodospirillales bacterium]|nr:NAD(P)-dependent oxidoreductase [Rhodospirillales bacterium]